MSDTWKKVLWLGLIISGFAASAFGGMLLLTFMFLMGMGCGGAIQKQMDQERQQEVDSLERKGGEYDMNKWSASQREDKWKRWEARQKHLVSVDETK